MLWDAPCAIAYIRMKRRISGTVTVVADLPDYESVSKTPDEDIGHQSNRMSHRLSVVQEDHPWFVPPVDHGWRRNDGSARMRFSARAVCHREEVADARHHPDYSPGTKSGQALCILPQHRSIHEPRDVLLRSIPSESPCQVSCPQHRRKQQAARHYPRSTQPGHTPAGCVAADCGYSCSRRNPDTSCHGRICPDDIHKSVGTDKCPTQHGQEQSTYRGRSAGIDRRFHVIGCADASTHRTSAR